MEVVGYCWEETVLGSAPPSSKHFCGKITGISIVLPLLLSITRSLGRGSAAARYTADRSSRPCLLLDWSSLLWCTPVTFPSYSRARFLSVGMIYLMCFCDRITMTSSITCPRCLCIARNAIFVHWAPSYRCSEREQIQKHSFAPMRMHCRQVLPMLGVSFPGCLICKLGRITLTDRK